MNSKQIEQNLGFLGQKLADMQIQATILILGGAVMVTQIGNRKNTLDIDIVLPQITRQLIRLSNEPSNLLSKKKKLSPTWLNDDVTLIVDQIGRPKTPTQWKTFAHLTTFVPELEYMLALKLFSGR